MAAEYDLQTAWGRLLGALARIPNSEKSERFYEAVNDMAYAVFEAAPPAAESVNTEKTRPSAAPRFDVGDPVEVLVGARRGAFGIVDSVAGRIGVLLREEPEPLLYFAGELRNVKQRTQVLDDAMLEELRKRGLITRQPSNGVLTWFLTEGGQQKLDELHPFTDAHRAALAAFAARGSIPSATACPHSTLMVNGACLECGVTPAGSNPER